jgi:hypothetical protein
VKTGPVDATKTDVIGCGSRSVIHRQRSTYHSIIAVENIDNRALVLVIQRCVSLSKPRTLPLKFFKELRVVDFTQNQFSLG